MAVRACALQRFSEIIRLGGSGAPLATRVSAQHSYPMFEHLQKQKLSMISRENTSKTSGISPNSQKPNSPLFNMGNLSQLLTPVALFNPVTVQFRGYQNVLKPRLICDGCYFVWRHGRRHVECSDHAKHKQMKRVAPRKVWKEDYSKGKIEKAMDWHTRAPREFKRSADNTAISHNWLAGKIGHEI